MSNIFFCIAGHIQNWSDSETYLNLGQPKTEKVRTSDGSSPGPHVPSQLIVPINYTCWNSSILQEDTLLINFGQSFSSFHPLAGYEVGTMPHYLSLEGHFKRKIRSPSDVWALGCTIFEIHAGSPFSKPSWEGTPRSLRKWCRHSGNCQSRGGPHSRIITCGLTRVGSPRLENMCGCL